MARNRHSRDNPRADKNGEIYFEIERGRADNKLITIYTRKQTGDKIKGTIETTIDGEERKSDWEAKRVD